VKLKLKNVKQHKNLDVELPDSGLVYIKGPSGIGKSTLFSAIAGSIIPNSDNPTHWDEKSSSVFVDFFSMEISKTRGPQCLKLKKGGSEYVDDEAQGEIFKTLGMNAQEFMASSYVEQGAANSLLSLSSADQLRFIQRLAFGDNDPETIKVKIKNAINSARGDLDARLRVVESLKEQLDDASKTLANIEVLAAPMSTITEEEYKELLKKRNEISKSISANNLKIEEINKKINNAMYALVDTFDKEESVELDIIKSLEAKRSEAHEKLLSAITTETAENISADIEYLKKTSVYETWLAEAVALKKEVNEKYPSTVGSKNISEDLDGFEKLIASQINGARHKISEYERDVANAANPVECPACSASLVIDGNALHKSIDRRSVDELVAKAKASIAILNTDISSKHREMSELLPYVNRMRKIKHTKIDKPEQRSVSLSLKDCLEKLKEITDKNTEVKMNESLIKTLTDDIFKRVSSLDSKRELIRASKDSLEPKDVLISMKDIAEKENKDTFDAYQSVQASLSEYAEYLEREAKYREASRSEDVASERVSLIQGQIDTLTEAAKDSGKRYGSMVKLKEISDRASMEAVEEIVQSINFNAKYYIDSMFQTTGTVCAFKNKKTLASGEERAKLSLSIFHKGSEVNNIKDLSGGEKARLTLAFQLALSDLYRSPILMLDEAFAGLDLPTKIECIESLREVSTRKLIVVIEHETPDSLFDFIYEFNSL